MSPSWLWLARRLACSTKDALLRRSYWRLWKSTGIVHNLSPPHYPKNENSKGFTWIAYFWFKMANFAAGSQLFLSDLAVFCQLSVVCLPMWMFFFFVFFSHHDCRTSLWKNNSFECISTNNYCYQKNGIRKTIYPSFLRRKGFQHNVFHCRCLARNGNNFFFFLWLTWYTQFNEKW